MKRLRSTAAVWLTGLLVLTGPARASTPETLELFVQMPLSVSLFTNAVSSAPVVSVGQTFMVCMTVSNSGAESAPNVTAAIWKTTGGGMAAISPVNPPAIAGLASGGFAVFTWTVTGTTAGSICWSGTSTAEGGSASAPVSPVCASMQAPAAIMSTLTIAPVPQVRVFSIVTARLTVKHSGQNDMRITSIAKGETDPLSLLGPAVGFPPALPVVVPGGGTATFTWTYQAVNCGGVPAVISASIFAWDVTLSQPMPTGLVQGNPITAATIPAALSVNVLTPQVKVAALADLTVAVLDSCVPAVAMANETVTLSVVTGGGQVMALSGPTDAAGTVRATIRTGYLPGLNAFLVSNPGLPGTTVFVEGMAGDTPTMYLSRNFIDPARGEKLQVRVTVPAPAKASARVYNLAGELVRVIREADVPPGLTVWEWDGRNAEGMSVGNGTYFIPIVVGKRLELRQVTVMCRP